MSTTRTSTLLTLTLLLTTLFSLISASPLASPLQPRNNGVNLASYTVPTSDGSSTTLPAPTGTLKAITLGRGTQNYTCASPTTATPSPVPVSIGALADLFDVTCLLNLIPASEGEALIDMLPPYLINFPLALVNTYSIPVLGHHYFNSAGQPTFDLGSTGFLVAKKTGDIPAPAGACPGQGDQGYGAVDWLNLVDAGGSTGLSEVYRVETAGGKQQPACDGFVGNIEVQYAALYWFYD